MNFPFEVHGIMVFVFIHINQPHYKFFFSNGSIIHGTCSSTKHSADGTRYGNAMQVHGGAGLSSDTILERPRATAKTLRIADGPDEMHSGIPLPSWNYRAKL
ncbi:hypothetical protein LWI29_015652 [Acer saccharum]|uniref:Acyl-CoA dehydrogenase/oxidase C-terminal domain-containing protein n=1 Tax=Acer saccharum TaxID=4024 RepID=A0AA39W9B3_ACESA|nr:hypothetical protein LWI29_015652 [Acer saccharum]